MKKHLQTILSLFCILCLMSGIAAVQAEETEALIVTVVWQDGNNYSLARPDSVTAELEANGQRHSVDLNEGNGWTSEVTVPAGTENYSWSCTDLSDRGYARYINNGEITEVRYSLPAQTTVNVQADIEWEDKHNDKGIRPKTVRIMLLADGKPYGEPKAFSVSETWTDLPQYKPGSDTPITYTAKPLDIPEGYSCSVSGTTVTFTLNTVSITVNAELAGYPEGTDLSNLRLIVDGPDPSMSRTLTYAEVADGCTLTDVLPGAYLIRDLNADTLVEGYIMDPENSMVCDAIYVDAETGSGTLNWKYTYKEPEKIEDLDADYDPLANVGNLTFRILGPDSRMPKTISYAQFEDGKFELEDLKPGVYTVVELDAQKLVKYYTLTSDSKTAVKLVVTAGDEPATARLYNQYAVAPTPEPEAEFVDVPVTKTWNDNNNKDGNRPESITVRLYADGVETDSHVLTEAEGWQYTFAELPRYQEDNKTEIDYSVNEDEAAMYTKEINGYNIVNHYLPEETSRTVAKVWKDSNDALQLRPSSIAMTLLLVDGNNETKIATVTLDKGNNWTKTVDHLPTVVNGKKAVYAWREQEVLGYKLQEAKEQGGTMTFVNTAIYNPPANNPPGNDKPPVKVVTKLDEYDTPMGVDVMINHVGDCFD